MEHTDLCIKTRGAFKREGGRGRDFEFTETMYSVKRKIMHIDLTLHIYSTMHFHELALTQNKLTCVVINTVSLLCNSLCLLRITVRIICVFYNRLSTII